MRTVRRRRRRRRRRRLCRRHRLCRRRRRCGTRDAPTAGATRAREGDLGARRDRAAPLRARRQGARESACRQHLSRSSSFLYVFAKGPLEVSLEFFFFQRPLRLGFPARVSKDTYPEDSILRWRARRWPPWWTPRARARRPTTVGLALNVERERDESRGEDDREPTRVKTRVV